MYAERLRCTRPATGPRTTQSIGRSHDRIRSLVD